MNDSLTNLAGWIPAIILPTASLLQMIKIVRMKCAEGVSIMTWFMFGIANLGLYVFTEKYFAIQAILGMLGTALINFITVGVIMAYRK